MKLRSFLGAMSVCSFAVVNSVSHVHASGYEIIDIGTLGGDSAEGNDINNAGEITGSSATSVNLRGSTTYRSHAFLYDGTMRDLVSSDDDWNSYYGHGLNDSGHVVGHYYTEATFFTHAFFYDGSIIHELGILPLAAGSAAYAINDVGQVTGAGIFSDPENWFILKHRKDQSSVVDVYVI